MKGSLKVYDREVAVDLGKYGAHSQHTFIDKKKDYTKAEWDKARVGWFCTPPKGEEDVEVLTDDACEQLNCTYLQREELHGMKLRMAVLREKAIAIKKEYLSFRHDNGVDDSSR